PVPRPEPPRPGSGAPGAPTTFPRRRPSAHRLQFGSVAKKRCEWAEGSDALMLAYHDQEWGTPSRDDRHLFEMLTLEGAQAGLSWQTHLNKREGYRRALAGFDPA